MKWLPAKNAPPATAEGLKLECSAVQERKDARLPEIDELRAALPALILEPARYSEATARLETLETEDRSDARTLAIIEAAIPEVEQREKRSRILAERDELDRATSKLAKGLPARYDKAANELAGILKEIDGNAHAWEVMNLRLSELGERGGDRAELRARQMSGTTGSYSQWSTNPSLTSHSSVLGWDERLLFDGKHVSWK